MKNLLTPTIIFLSALALTFFGVSYFKQPQQSVGVALPDTASIFETSLQTGITSSATSLTLTANSIRGGGALSGYSCLTLDEGSTNAEQICGTISGTAMTGLTRGISYADGITEVAGNKFSHRRGASVKQTDAPIIQLLKAQNNGDATFPNLLTYTNTVLIDSGSASTTIATKHYVDSVSVAGASDASLTVKGITELATQTEMASTTSTGGTSANLSLWSAYSTSTPDGTSQAGLFVPVSKNNGKLHQLWLDLTEAFTWTGAHIFSSTVTFNGLFTANATSTMATTTIAKLTVDENITATAGTSAFGTVSSGTLTSTTFTNSGTASTTDMYISGDQTGGSMTYTASSTVFSVSSGTVTYTGSIPTNANNGMGKWKVNNSTNGDYKQGTFVLNRTGLTTFQFESSETNNDYIYTVTWSGANFSVQEIADTSTLMSLSGTVYWYK